MMTTFHWVHIIVGVWLAIANFTGMLPTTTLILNNTILGIVVAIYNAYFLFAKNNVDAQQS